MITQIFIKLHKFKKGLTLLEIILAIAIMAFAIVPIMNFAPSIMSNKEGVEQMTESVFLATQKMEEVRGFVMTDFAATRAEGETAFTGDYSGYRYDVTDDPGVNIKTIRVRAWHQLDPSDKIVLHTLIARRIGGSPPPPPTSRVYNFVLAQGYSLIQSPVSDIDVKKSHTVGARDEIFTEDIVINCNWTDGGAILVGGYGSDWVPPDGTTVTTISGSVTIEAGVVEMKYFVIE